MTSPISTGGHVARHVGHPGAHRRVERQVQVADQELAVRRARAPRLPRAIRNARARPCPRAEAQKPLPVRRVRALSGVRLRYPTACRFSQSVDAARTLARLAACTPAERRARPKALRATSSRRWSRPASSGSACRPPRRRRGRPGGASSRSARSSRAATRRPAGASPCCATAGWSPPTSRGPAAREIFGDSGVVRRRRVRAQGQGDRRRRAYRVTGRWPFSSGIDHCDWLMGGCVVIEDGSPQMLARGGRTSSWCSSRRRRSR